LNSKFETLISRNFEFFVASDYKSETA